MIEPEKTKDFYCNILGAELLRTQLEDTIGTIGARDGAAGDGINGGMDQPNRMTIRSYWFLLDNAVLMLERAGHIERSSLPCCVLGAAPETMAKIKQRLIEKKHDIYKETAFTFYFYDPNQNSLGFSSYSFFDIL